MGEIERLIDRLEELDDLLAGCMKCGLCQAVCPVFTETGLEGDVTRGKLYLLEGVARKMISDAKGVKQRLDKCLLCGTCAANCPSGVNALEIFLKARIILTEFIGLSPVKKVIFRNLIAHPRLFNRIMSLSGRFQGLFITPASPQLETYCSRALSRFMGERHFRRLAEVTFSQGPEKWKKPGKTSKYKVALFPGCVVDKMFPQVAMKTARVLERHNVEVSIPDVQICCGIPSLASGDRKSFTSLLSQNLDSLIALEADFLVTPCATCTSTIRKIWPMMGSELLSERKEQINKLAASAMDISQFLVDVVKISSPALSSDGKGKRVTYHDPCHLGKSLGVYQQPRMLLQSLSDCSFVEMKDADVCCGNGGSFNLQHYQTSGSIGENKIHNIQSVEADVVATSCPACMMQLIDLLSRNEKPIAVKHVIELYEEDGNQ